MVSCSEHGESKSSSCGALLGAAGGDSSLPSRSGSLRGAIMCNVRLPPSQVSSATKNSPATTARGIPTVVWGFDGACTSDSPEQACATLQLTSKGVAAGALAAAISSPALRSARRGSPCTSEGSSPPQSTRTTSSPLICNRFQSSARSRSASWEGEASCSSMRPQGTPQRRKGGPAWSEWP
ncbi:MAG: hypothetical protein SGPRY_004190 [Prymnesium sp.]